MEEITFEVIPHYVDEILVDGSKSHRALIKKANAVLREYSMGSQYSFDGDECPIEMEFYDGIALATDGIKYGYLFFLIEYSIMHPTIRITIVRSAYSRIIILM